MNYIDQLQSDINNLKKDYYKARNRNENSECEKIMDSMFFVTKKYKTYIKGMLERIKTNYSSLNNPEGIEKMFCDLKDSYYENLFVVEQIEDSISKTQKKSVN